MLDTEFTILFDLDGTLLNTLGDLADAINNTLRTLGYPEKTETEVLAAIGNGLRRAIIAVLPGLKRDDEIDAALIILREQYSQCYMNRTHPYPGILELLRVLRDEGYKVAVISNKADEYTTGLVKKHFGELVDAAAGERPGIPMKPAPDALWGILKQVGGVPERAVYVGDSEVDIAAAQNAGIPYILVNWGFRDRDTLIRAGADPAAFADSADEVLDKIRTFKAKI